jgi:hypothetical protein
MLTSREAGRAGFWGRMRDAECDLQSAPPAGRAWSSSRGIEGPPRSGVRSGVPSVQGRRPSGGQPSCAVHASRGVVVHGEHDGERPERQRGLLSDFNSSSWRPGAFLRNVELSVERPPPEPKDVGRRREGMLAPRGSWGRPAAVALELVSSIGAHEVGEDGSRRARGWEAGPPGGAQEFGGGRHGGRHDAKVEDGGVRARVPGIPGSPPKIQSNPPTWNGEERPGEGPPPPTQYYHVYYPASY